MMKMYGNVCNKCRKSKITKISYIFEKHQFFLLFAVSMVMNEKKYLKKKNQLKC